MSWGRIDDQLDDDPRFWGLDLTAQGLWRRCPLRCLRSESPEVIRALVDREAGADAGRLAQILVDRGLWREAGKGDGWEYACGGFAGWDAISLPARLREAKTAQQSEAGKASAEARRAKWGSPIPKNARNAPTRSHGGRTTNRTG